MVKKDKISDIKTEAADLVILFGLELDEMDGIHLDVVDMDKGLFVLRVMRGGFSVASQPCNLYSLRSTLFITKMLMTEKRRQDARAPISGT